ncbi:uncharacterized protein PADG_11516 [Paracoccidioides brasiliensis Pb18]|uniref:Uncharacterized protein n=1 Tax=Paracoccidioides brasiliensis (strain Pb18) TaxID=502780 RepID=A0A0A0HWA1_PARBD|nr:uncharacterized protein PADG_11516 [Paracoccidioides brasiliensis Pb18]KGM92321.1 hypothetical protein PADG_11516 [Paracoccidioides brasiliensis Pb18]
MAGFGFDGPEEGEGEGEGEKEGQDVDANEGGHGDETLRTREPLNRISILCSPNRTTHAKPFVQQTDVLRLYHRSGGQQMSQTLAVYRHLRQ